MKATPEPEAMTTTFTRDDGREIGIVPGFRERALGYRPAVTPKPGWSDEDYGAAAAKKLRRFERLLETVKRWRPELAGARVLDVGCGDAANCVLMATQPVREVVGIDLYLPLLDASEKSAPARRLADALAREAGAASGAAQALSRLPLRLEVMEAGRMSFDDATFDVLISRSAMEHLSPIEGALAEMARVVRPGGLVHHSIDPFYWPRGCHKRGVVDIPWAHARLTLGEYHRFVAAREGAERAAERTRRLETLNRLTLAQWRDTIAAGPFEVLDWEEEPSDFAREVLGEFPEVPETLVRGVTRSDLVCGRINAWLRRL